MTPRPQPPGAPVAGNTKDIDPATARMLWQVLFELNEALRTIEKKLS